MYRLEVAKKLGADVVINVDAEDPLAKVREATGGLGVDVSLDCTAGAGTIPVLFGLEALRRKGGTMLIQGETANIPKFSVGGRSPINMSRLKRRAAITTNHANWRYNSSPLIALRLI